MAFQPGNLGNSKYSDYDKEFFLAAYELNGRKFVQTRKALLRKRIKCPYNATYQWVRQKDKYHKLRMEEREKVIKLAWSNAVRTLELSFDDAKLKELSPEKAASVLEKLVGTVLLLQGEPTTHVKIDGNIDISAIERRTQERLKTIEAAAGRLGGAGADMLPVPAESESTSTVLCDGDAELLSHREQGRGQATVVDE
jgi:hypothetical protein